MAFPAKTGKPQIKAVKISPLGELILYVLVCGDCAQCLYHPWADRVHTINEIIIGIIVTATCFSCQETTSAEKLLPNASKKDRLA